MPVKRQILFILLFLCADFAVGQRIEFFKEELVFTIDSSCFSVNGDYYFRNPSKSSRTFTVLYPVSKTEGYKPIDTILVYDVSEPNKPLKVGINDSIASFTLSFLPFSEKCVKIFFKQHHGGSRAKYILLTTRKWQRPLESASYSLITPKGITVSHFSIPPDKSEDFGQTRLYYWTRTNFMPDRDFVFYLTIKKIKKKKIQ